MMGARVLKQQEKVKEGELFNKWVYRRMIKRNKNILTACTGPTGSGKSYQDLRRLELWYQYYFKKQPPIENVCFSVAELMRRLNSKELVKGDILVLEEAGANLGSLDFQNKIVKTFTYVLQSFRSLNVGIFFNLPYLSMLNKQARMLIHAQFITSGIDAQTNTSKSKTFFLQINQQTGKVYTKYLRVKKGGMYVPIKRFKYSLPSEKLIKQYEDKKFKFVSGLTEEFSAELDKLDREALDKLQKPLLTDKQRRYYELRISGLNQKESCERMEIPQSNGCEIEKAIKKKGYIIENRLNTKKKTKITNKTSPQSPST